VPRNFETVKTIKFRPISAQTTKRKDFFTPSIEYGQYKYNGVRAGLDRRHWLSWEFKWPVSPEVEVERRRSIQPSEPEWEPPAVAWEGDQPIITCLGLIRQTA
jgi:hypothetical protein